MKKLCLTIFLLLAGARLGVAGGNEPFVPVTENLNTLPTLQRHLGVDNPPPSGPHGEDAARYAELFKQDVVISGGTHGISGTCVSSAFPLVAYTNAGNRLVQTPTAINYSVLGCNCDNPGSDIGHVIASAQTLNSIGNFQRVAGTDYFVNCTDAAPSLPSDSVLLLKVSITNGAISRVDNISRRSLLPSEASVGTLYASQYGVLCDGVTSQTANIQNLLDSLAAAGGGKLILPRGTCVTDTLILGSNTTLEGNATTLSFMPHSTSHNPVIRIGTVTQSASKAVVRNLKIDGNKIQQTAVGDEFSPGIMIWGSDENLVENNEIFDCRGDGVTIGFDNGRLVGSNRNVVRHNEIYDNSRTALAITWGDENVLEYNKSTGVFDLERDPDRPTSTIKKNIVHGNTGRTGNQDASDFNISLGSLNEDEFGYFGNIVTNNVIAEFFGQLNTHTVITGNVFVGTSTTQESLLRLWGFYNATVCNNLFKANASVATGLLRIIDIRAGANLNICNNIVENGTLPFSDFTGPFFAENFGYGHIYSNNILTGTGAYHANINGPERIGETATLRIQTEGTTPNIIGIFQMSGPPLYPPGPCNGNIGAGFTCGRISFLRIGTGLNINFPSGSFWTIEVLPYGTLGAIVEPYNHTVKMKIDEQGTGRTIEPWLAPVGASETYQQLSFADGGQPSRIFIKITY